MQYMSEKIGGAKGTELDDEFVEMEKVNLDVSQLSHLSNLLLKTLALSLTTLSLNTSTSHPPPPPALSA